MADLTQYQTMTPEERAQLRQTLLQKYNDANDMSDINTAKDDASQQNMISGIGQGLATIGNSGGVAAGGPQIGGAGFDAQRQAARDALKTAYEGQQAKANQALTNIQMQQGFDKEDRDIATQAAQAAEKNQEFGLAQQQHKADQAQLDKYHNDEMDLKRQQLDAENARKTANGSNDTVAQKYVNETFGKDYGAWKSTGRQTTLDSIADLEKAKGQLLGQNPDGTPTEKASGPLGGLFPASGAVNGILPEVLRSTDSKVMEQNVRGSAGAALRATLGSVFTEKEGERIMKNSYDPALPPEENAKKIDRALNELKSKLSEKDAQTNFYEKNKSLNDYRSGAGSTTATPAPHGQTVVQDGTTYTWNGSEYVPQ